MGSPILISNGTKGVHIDLPRVGLRTQVYIWGVVALALTLPILIGSIWVAANMHAYKLVEDQINQGLTGLDYEMDADAENLKSTAKWLVSDDTFVDFVKRQDKNAAEPFASAIGRYEYR